LKRKKKINLRKESLKMFYYTINIKKEDKENVVEINEKDLVKVDKNWLIEKIHLKTGGNLSGKSFWLNPFYDYSVVKDDQGALVLLPLEKKKET
jgi:hypothetical protein